MTLRAVLAGVGMLVLVVGCGQAPAAPRPSLGAATASDLNTPALVAQRVAAGLPDCAVPSGGQPVRQDGLPAVTLPCLGSDRAVDLSQLRGRPMVVNLWAQWCDPCKAEAPVLAEFARRASGTVDVVGVDFNDPDPAAAIAFAQKAGWTYPQLVDSGALLKDRLTLPGIPVTLLVAADGRVVYRFTGGIPSTEALAAVVAERLGVTV